MVRFQLGREILSHTAGDRPRRHYRDALSAALMISNDRIAAQSANMLLVFKDDQE